MPPKVMVEATLLDVGCYQRFMFLLGESRFTNMRPGMWRSAKLGNILIRLNGERLKQWKYDWY